MSYERNTVSNNVNELTFLQSFITAITTTCNKVTCLTNDLETQFSSTSNTPEFALSINNRLVLTFTRANALSTVASNYVITFSDDSTAYAYLDFMHYTEYHYYDESGNRTWKYTVFSNSKTVRIDFGSYDTDMKTPVLSILLINDTGINGYNYCFPDHNDDPAIKHPFTMLNNTSVTKIDRMLYVYNNNNVSQIEIVRNKVFVLGTPTERFFTFSGLLDCSSVIPDVQITIGNNTYYSLDEHTLMEI